MSGAGTLTLSGDNSSFAGGIDVQSGTLVAASATALGTSAATTSVENGETLDFATAYSGPENIDLAGGTVENTSGDVTLAGSVTLIGSAASTIASDSSGGTFTLAGPLGLNDGALSLTSLGSGAPSSSTGRSAATATAASPTMARPTSPSPPTTATTRAPRR